MLLRFGVENHKSVRNYQQILLTASSIKDDATRLLQSSDSRVKVVPVAAIYGANASGKSTLLDALRFMQSVVRFSHTRGDATGGTAYAPFALDEVSSTRPSRYDIDLEFDETRFHYGFIVDGKKVNEEWLFAIPLNKTRKSRQTWFHRTDDGEPIYFGKELKGENKLIEKIVRANSLFLSAAAQNAHQQLSKIYELIVAKMEVLSTDSNAVILGSAVAKFFDEHKELEGDALEFLKVADTGISNVTYEVIEQDDQTKNFVTEFRTFLKRHSISALDEATDFPRRRASFTHKGVGGKEYRLKLDAESAGTKAILSAIGPILSALRSGGVLIIDELSNSLHPLMSRKLVGLFGDQKINVGGAQLVFSTHDTNLLCDGMFRRDQIWFAEKDREGATHFFPLTEIDVDKRDNLEKGYLNGRFGAIPFFSKPDIKWETTEDLPLLRGEHEDA
ncbi:AAA family ATPase [Paraburkholderia oxyphila]|uniref:AAA family ATPase n=1 Tax=Paraburkholderia oxyphila TaxID=614212 RepID=UPI00048A015E|nr:ATP-binding protein [Paraburkholderia oxyphila]